MKGPPQPNHKLGIPWASSVGTLASCGGWREWGKEKKPKFKCSAFIFLGLMQLSTTSSGTCSFTVRKPESSRAPALACTLQGTPPGFGVSGLAACLLVLVT